MLVTRNFLQTLASVFRLYLFVLLPLLLLGIVGCDASEAGPVEQVTPGDTTRQSTRTPAALAEAKPTSTTTAVPSLELTPETTVTPSPIVPFMRSTATVRPVQVKGYIPNPFMGWQDTQRHDKRFVETVGYTRVNWRELNPAEGEYDWSPIESLREHMAGLGGTISFRVRPAQPPPWGQGHAMPDWLVERGAMITDSSSDILEGVASTEPLYSGCLFLEAQAELVDAMRQRYDGDPDVAFIDIGSYGNYGEWDSEQYDDQPESLDWHARRRIIDMYLGGQGVRPCQKSTGEIESITYDYAGFQETRLIMPYTPWFADSLEYALSRRQDLGIRHDALGSEKHQERYREEIGALVEQRWPYAPIIFEFYPDAFTPEALQSARDFALEMHASFIHENFDGQGSNTLIEKLLAEVGYRLVLQELTYTSTLRPGEELVFDMTWENIGVAPPYFKTYPLVVSLTDAAGLPLLEKQLEPDIGQWLPHEPIQIADKLLLPADFPGGAYDLRIAFIDPVSGVPALQLAIAGIDEHGRYLMGRVVVGPDG